MYQSEAASQAAMISGSPDEVADRLVSLFKELGVL
jgi:hypothetical protein